MATPWGMSPPLHPNVCTQVTVPLGASLATNTSQRPTGVMALPPHVVALCTVPMT